MLQKLDQVYSLTHQEMESVGYYVPKRDTKVLTGDLEGVYLLMPLSGKNLSGETRAYYLTGQDIKTCVKAIIDAYGLKKHDNEYTRTPYAIYFDVQNQDDGISLVDILISFESFKTVNDILRHFDWIMPMVAWSKDKAYYRDYAMHCCELEAVITYCPFSTNATSSFDNIISITGVTYCDECESESHPYLGIHCWDLASMFVKSLLRGDALKVRHVIDASWCWDSPYYDIHNLIIDSCIDKEAISGTVTLEKVVELTNCEALKVLLKPLPFQYIKPFPLEEALCKDCLERYSPPWSFQNAKYYSKTCITLKLTWSKHQVPWDIVLLVMEYIVTLRYYTLGN